MPNNPKTNGEKLALVLEAWEELRPAKSFAGMTLDQFKTAVKPSLDARKAIDDLDADMTAAILTRDKADVVTMEKVAEVVDAVKGDIAEGPDGELYAAMGYVPKSQRKTGKTNKTKPATPAK
jgi:hypothetical protein